MTLNGARLASERLGSSDLIGEGVHELWVRLGEKRHEV
jgi:hypothetical protein